LIVYADRPGQLANMLYIYEAFLSYGFHYGVRVYNLGFYRYSHYFEGTKQQSYFFNLILFNIFSIFSRFLIRFHIKFKYLSAIGLKQNEQFDLDSQGQFLVYGFHFLRGWQFRAPESQRKFKSEINSFFSPVSSYQRAIDEFFNERLLLDDSLIVGVHIRLGDYRHFEGGRYYYDLSIYRRFMSLVASSIESKVKFLVCSNEQLNKNEVSVEAAESILGLGNELLDLYSLARCNLIIGPPSTYSLWASKYGQVPLLMIRNPLGTLAENDFSPSRPNFFQEVQS
jgi:hypothetical protein